MDKKRLECHLKPFLFIFLLSFSVGFVLLDSPMFVDEGHFLTLSKGILKGEKLYLDSRDNKPPGLYLFLIPVVTLAGKSVFLIRFIALSILALNAFLVYLIGFRISGSRAGIFASVLFLLISIAPRFQSHTLISENISLLFISAAIYLLLNKKEFKTYLLAGALIGLACSIRQLSFLAFIPVLFSLRGGNYKKNALWLLSGVLLAWVPLLIFLILFSSPTEFLNYAFLDIIMKPKHSALSPWEFKTMVFVDVFAFTLPAILLGVVGISKKRNAILFSWLAAMFLSTQVGHGYHHYYLLMFAPLSVYASLGLLKLESISKEKIGLIKPLILGFILAVLISQSLSTAIAIKSHQLRLDQPSFMLTSEQQASIVNFIDEKISKEQSVMYFSMQSSLYYMSDRFPPNGRVPSRVVMAEEDFSESFLNQLMEEPPDVIVYDQDYAYYLKSFELFGENTVSFEKFLNENYELSSTIDNTYMQVYLRKP